eukprot:s51_g25.t1
MWTRYQESASVFFPPSATEGELTPFSRYPLQDAWLDGFYNTLVYIHVVLALTYLSLMLWQFLAMKGTSEHVRRGLVLKWMALIFLGGGWALQIRHAWFSDPKVFEKHPALFSLPFSRNWVSSFGSSTVVSALNCFLVGVSEKSGASCGGPVHLFLLTATSVSLAVDVNGYVYIFRELSTTEPWSNYHWDMLVEQAVSGIFFPLYDILNLYVLIRWYRTGFLDYKGHHVMNAIFTVTLTLAAALLFTAHDAYFFWPYPGITLFYRWAVQLVPQTFILVPYVSQIFSYVTGASRGAGYDPIATQAASPALAQSLQEKVNANKT